MRSAMPPKKHVNTAHNKHALMDYHVQTTYAMNRLNLVITPQSVAVVPTIHALQVNASNLLVDVNSPVVQLGICGWT